MQHYDGRAVPSARCALVQMTRMKVRLSLLASLVVALPTLLTVASSAAEDDGFFGGGFQFGDAVGSFDPDGATLGVNGPFVGRYRADYSAVATAIATSPQPAPGESTGITLRAGVGYRFDFGARGPGLVFGEGSSTSTASISGGGDDPRKHTANAGGGGALFGLGYSSASSAGIDSAGTRSESRSFQLIMPIGGAQTFSIGDNTSVRASAGREANYPESTATASAESEWAFVYVRNPQPPVINASSCSSFDTRNGPVIVLIHGWYPEGRPTDNWFTRANSSIETSKHVVEWNSTTGFAGAAQALLNAREAGHALADQIVEAIQQPGCEVDLKKIHLVGHSYGAAVIDTVGMRLRTGGFGKIGQATTIEMPQRKFFGLGGPNEFVIGFNPANFENVMNIFAESFDAAGAPLQVAGRTPSNVANVALDPALLPGGGVVHSKVANKWSSLITDLTSSPLLQGPGTSQRVVGDFREGSDGELVPANFSPAEIRVQPHSKSVFDDKAIEINTSRDTSGSIEGHESPNNGGAGILSLLVDDGLPAAISGQTTVPPYADFIRFAYNFPTQGDGDTLSLHFDGQQLFFATVVESPPGEFFDSGYIGIHHLQGTTGQLSIVLDSHGAPNASFVVRDLSFYSVVPVPEPASILLLSSGLILPVAISIRRRR